MSLIYTVGYKSHIITRFLETMQVKLQAPNVASPSQSPIFIVGRPLR